MAIARPQTGKQIKNSPSKKKKSKVSKVMGEFKSGKLKSSSGKKVKEEIVCQINFLQQ